MKNIIEAELTAAKSCYIAWIESASDGQSRPFAAENPRKVSIPAGMRNGVP